MTEFDAFVPTAPGEYRVVNTMGTTVGKITVTEADDVAPTPKQREEREELDLDAIEARLERADDMVTALCKPRGSEGARDWIMSIPARPDHDPDLVIGEALSDAGRLLKALRTHSPEERVWHWCLQTDDWKAYPQLACSYCGSRGPNIHTLTFGDDRPNWKPEHSPEEPVGYIVVGVDAGDKPNPSTASRRVFRTLIQAQEIREHLEQHGVFDAYVIFPIGQPLDGEEGKK